MPLLALGWVLVAVLPVIAAVLVVTEYDDYQAASEQRSRLIADAVQRQLLDRLYLVGRQLADSAGREAEPVVPMAAVVQRPATAGDPPVGAPLQVGAPVLLDGRWQLPVAQRVGDRVVQARINASLLTEVVRGYRLGRTEFVSLIHDQKALVAGSFDSDRAPGQSMASSPLFLPAHANQAEGRYRSRTVSDGRIREHAFRRMAGTGLTIVVGTEPPRLIDLWARPAAAIVAVALLLALGWGWLVRRLEHAHEEQDALIDRLGYTLQAVRYREERLQQAQQLARLGEYGWDPHSGVIHLTSEGARLYGLPDDTRRMDLDAVLALVHPDDRAALQAMGERLIAHGEPAEIQFRIQRPDGTQRVVLARSVATRDEEGRPIVRGFQQDVTELVDARESAVRAQAQYRFLFEHNPLPMWVFDRETLEIVAVNDAMVAHYGYDRETLVGASMLSIRPESEHDALRDAVRVPSGTHPQGRIWTHLHRDGRTMRMAVHSHDIAFDGRMARLVAAQDVTERERAEERFRLVSRATSDVVYDYDVERSEIWWSDSYYTRFGTLPTPMAPLEEWASRVHAADHARVTTGIARALERDDAEWQEQYRYRRGDGSYALVIDRAFIQRDVTGRALRVVGGMLDMSERENYEERLAYRATHDALTDLPNRQLLQRPPAAGAAERAAPRPRRGALIFIDLDDFKLVNDTLGHSAGDQLLCEVAQRACAALRARNRHRRRASAATSS